MNRTVLTLSAVAAGLTLTLTACGSQPATVPDNGDSIASVVVEATPSPEANPANTPDPDVPVETANPADIVPGDITNPTPYTLEVPVGYAFSIPTQAKKGQVIDVAQDGDSLTRDIPKTGVNLYGDLIEGAEGLLYYAAKPGVTTGSIRVLGPDGTPTGAGTEFTVKVVAAE